MMESRKITMEDVAKRRENPIKQATFELVMDKEDFLYEDSTPLTIALPRLIWKVLYAISKATGDSVSVVASELITDHAYVQFDLMKGIDKWMKQAIGVKP